MPLPLLTHICGCHLGPRGFPGGACWTPALVSSSGEGPLAVWGQGQDGPLTVEGPLSPPSTLTFPTPSPRASLCCRHSGSGLDLVLALGLHCRHLARCLVGTL